MTIPATRAAPQALALLLLATGIGAADADAIPYPEALAHAAVRITGLKPGDAAGNRRANGLVVGDGDLTVIVSVAAPDIVLRVTKNDAWDGRIDTSGDPALPVIDPATHGLKREKPGNPPSWNLPTPCAVPSADIRLAGIAGETGWDLRLDLARGVATVATSADTTTVRVLAGGIIAIGTGRTLRLDEVAQGFLPAAAAGGDTDGRRWLIQTIPGDRDIAGMTVHLVAGSEGREHRVAVVSSNDAPDPGAQARRLVDDSLATAPETLIREHEQRWARFWARSGVQLSDAARQDWWYRMVYFFGCFSRPGGTAVGLKACLDGLAGWHDSYKFNYNIQQTYFSAGIINHPELADPIIDVLVAYWPRARWLAATCFAGCEGAFVHSDVFHPHEPDPAACTTRNQHQFAYIPFGFSLGMQGHIAVLLWERHLYQPDATRLRTRLYPLLRDIALFYCSFIERCRRDPDGRPAIGPSYFPENGYFGQDDTAYDLPYIAYGLAAARAAAQALGTDAELVRRIDAILAAMPAYPTVPDPAQGGQPVVTYCRGARLPDDDRHGSLIQAVFPAGQVTWRSPAAEQELFRRTIDLVGRITTHANSPVTLNIARARLGMVDEAWRNLEADFSVHHVPQPNGLFAWKAHGSYISEQVGVARLVSELLLQSETGIIRLFPAWPRERDAAFTGLRAYGGFVVTARSRQGAVLEASILSTVGGELRVLSPWPRAQVTTGAGTPVAATSGADGVLVFATEAGVVYRLSAP